MSETPAAPTNPSPLAAVAASVDSGTRPYRVYRVVPAADRGSIPDDTEVLVLEATVEADESEAAIRETAQKRDMPGTEYISYPERFEKRKRPRKRVEETWILD